VKVEAGISLIEVMLAALILAICSMGAIGMIDSAIATNTRNKFDSTAAMLAQSIVEQIAATAVGSGTGSLIDCAGTSWTIETQPGGATLNGGNIDFTQPSPPSSYHMSYVIKSPCTGAGTEQAAYDVRWNVGLIGSPLTPTNTYVLTVGAQMQNRGFGNMRFAAPVTMRVMLAN
jgi:hypothetical protein